MNTRKSMVICVALVALSAAAAAQSWAGIPQFSADMKMSGGRGQGMGGKIYFGGQKTRFEMGGGPRGEMIMIHDGAKQVSYMLMPSEKMYMEMSSAMRGMGRGPRMPDAKAVDPANPCSAEQEFTCKKVGSETVNGRSCDKWEFTHKSNPKMNRTAWIDQKLHFPIKNVGAEGDTWELQNLTEGPQAASLFEIPAGYTKMDMPGMMGGRTPQ